MRGGSRWRRGFSHSPMMTGPAGHRSLPELKLVHKKCVAWGPFRLSERLVPDLGNWCEFAAGGDDPCTELPALLARAILFAVPNASRARRREGCRPPRFAARR